MPPLDLTLPPGPVTSEFRQSIERALDRILKPEEQVAIVGVADATGKMQLAAAVRTENGHFTLGSEVEWKWGRPDVSGRVYAILSF